MTKYHHGLELDEGKIPYHQVVDVLRELLMLYPQGLEFGCPSLHKLAKLYDDQHRHICDRSKPDWTHAWRNAQLLHRWCSSSLYMHVMIAERTKTAVWRSKVREFNLARFQKNESNEATPALLAAPDVNKRRQYGGRKHMTKKKRFGPPTMYKQMANECERQERKAIERKRKKERKIKHGGLVTELTEWSVGMAELKMVAGRATEPLPVPLRPFPHMPTTAYEHYIRHALSWSYEAPKGESNTGAHIKCSIVATCTALTNARALRAFTYGKTALHISVLHIKAMMRQVCRLPGSPLALLSFYTSDKGWASICGTMDTFTLPSSDQCFNIDHGEEGVQCFPDTSQDGAVSQPGVAARRDTGSWRQIIGVGTSGCSGELLPSSLRGSRGRGFDGHRPDGAVRYRQPAGGAGICECGYFRKRQLSAPWNTRSKKKKISQRQHSSHMCDATCQHVLYKRRLSYLSDTTVVPASPDDLNRGVENEVKQRWNKVEEANRAPIKCFFCHVCTSAVDADLSWEYRSSTICISLLQGLMWQKNTHAGFILARQARQDERDATEVMLHRITDEYTVTSTRWISGARRIF
ncbi:hypothetical protein PR048_023473 [Dryococelus australis]|uniref:Uncharacterized protein n=1 Tax=Dryococelus australis TaxID=614101 RepID=A0ABQ9GU81_9NEOP|nr:hypothetical protein PR048_023473 [Dryococelus australis]